MNSAYSLRTECINIFVIFSNLKVVRVFFFLAQRKKQFSLVGTHQPFLFASFLIYHPNLVLIGGSLISQFSRLLQKSRRELI